MISELSKICFYRNERIATNALNNRTYVSTESMLPDKGGITYSSSLPTVSQTPKFKRGDTLVSNIRPYFKKIWFAEYDGGCSNDVLVFSAKEDVDPKFLYYVLANDSFFAYSTATSKGTKMPRGDKNSIMKYQIEMVDLPTQKKIAAMLSVLDEKIEKNTKINDNLEQQASALIGKYIESTDAAVPFADIMSFDNGFAFQSSTYLPSGKYRIITIKNVQDGYIDSTGAAFIDNIPSRMKSSCILHIGDVLLSLTGNVGRVGIVCEEGLLLNQRVAKIAPKDKVLLPLLYFIYRQPGMKTQMESIAKGTAQLNLSPIETLNLTVPYEKESATSLSKILAPLYHTIISNSQESIVLASLRDTLLPKLMSGEIDVSDIQL